MWTLFVLAQDPQHAKTRLSTDPAIRARLARSFLNDVIAQCQSVRTISRLAIVSPVSWPVSCELIHQDQDDLNDFLRKTVKDEPGPTAIMVSDLPRLSTDELADSLALATRFPQFLVPDTNGTGTTVLGAATGADIHPAFGVGSAAKHMQRGHTPIPAAIDLRADVDVWADLRTNDPTNLGAATRRALNSL